MTDERAWNGTIRDNRYSVQRPILHGLCRLVICNCCTWYADGLNSSTEYVFRGSRSSTHALIHLVKQHNAQSTIQHHSHHITKPTQRRAMYRRAFRLRVAQDRLAGGREGNLRTAAIGSSGRDFCVTYDGCVLKKAVHEPGSRRRAMQGISRFVRRRLCTLWSCTAE